MLPSTATASRACHKWRRLGLPDQASAGRLPKKRDRERSWAMKLPGRSVVLTGGEGGGDCEPEPMRNAAMTWPKEDARGRSHNTV